MNSYTGMTVSFCWGLLVAVANSPDYHRLLSALLLVYYMTAFLHWLHSFHHHSRCHCHYLTNSGLIRKSLGSNFQTTYRSIHPQHYLSSWTPGSWVEWLAWPTYISFWRICIYDCVWQVIVLLIPLLMYLMYLMGATIEWFIMELCDFNVWLVMDHMNLAKQPLALIALSNVVQAC